jgi:hypothetical protein
VKEQLNVFCMSEMFDSLCWPSALITSYAQDFPHGEPSQPNPAASGATLDSPGGVETEQNAPINGLPTITTQTPHIASYMFDIPSYYPDRGLGPIPDSFNIEKIPFFEPEYEDFTNLSHLTQGLPSFQKTKAKANSNSGEEFEYLPVAMLPIADSPDEDGQVYRLRIVNQDNFYEDDRKIEHLVENLRKRLFSHHYRLSKRLGISDHARIRDRISLHGWFRQGLFKPFQSLPATGNVYRGDRGKGLGLMQQWVIWYLYSEDLDRTASITALALNGWQKIMEQNDCFWTFVSTHVPELDQSGKGVRFPPFEPKKHANQLTHLGSGCQWARAPMGYPRPDGSWGGYGQERVEKYSSVTRPAETHQIHGPGLGRLS